MQTTEPLYVALGSIINRLRIERGLGLRDLAEATGLTVSALSYIELGQSRVQLHSLCQIADRLEVDAGILLSEARLLLSDA